jgi:hypothetical protein
MPYFTCIHIIYGKEQQPLYLTYRDKDLNTEDVKVFKKQITTNPDKLNGIEEVKFNSSDFLTFLSLIRSYDYILNSPPVLSRLMEVGQLSHFQYFLSNGGRLNPYFPLDKLSTDVVKFLHDNKLLSNDMLINQPSNLDNIKLLDELGYEITYNIKNCIYNDNVQVFSYIANNRDIVTQATLYECCYFSAYNIASFLLDNYKWPKSLLPDVCRKLHLSHVKKITAYYRDLKGCLSACIEGHNLDNFKYVYQLHKDKSNLIDLFSRAVIDSQSIALFILQQVENIDPFVYISIKANNYECVAYCLKRGGQNIITTRDEKIKELLAFYGLRTSENKKYQKIVVGRFMFKICRLL